MNNKTYYLYHIPGKKIGVTQNIKNRVVIEQGYNMSEFEILEASNDIDYISLKEKQLQEIYGYKIDRDLYKQVINKKSKLKMKLNVTEQTTTFPYPINKLKGNLMDNLGMSIETNFGNYVLNLDLVNWIMDSVKTSMYNPSRSFIYNKALHEFCNSKKSKIQLESEQNKNLPSTYDLIRQWADDRGIYKSGDAKTQYVKLIEEAGELAKALLKNDKPEIIDAIGDMVVVLTNLAALEGLKIEDCTLSAYNEIKDRDGSMQNGTFVKKINNHLISTL